jgi:phosphatidate cytidylyltransferase
MKRLIVAAIGIPVLIAAGILGGWWLAGAVVVIQLLALYEWRALLSAAGWPLNLPAAVATTLLVDIAVLQSFDPRVVAGLVLAILLMLLLEVFGRERKPLNAIAAQTAYLVWIVAPFAIWPLLAHLPGASRFQPLGPLVALFATTWLCDSAAYYIGRAVGGAKLFPAASPNKTWAGFWGGLAGAALLIPLSQLTGLAQPRIIDYFAFPLICGVVGQVGDLLESLVKRQVQVKDSSNLLPGHGGILDRFDSLLLSTPALFAYLVLFPF